MVGLGQLTGLTGSGQISAIMRSEEEGSKEVRGLAPINWYESAAMAECTNI